MKSGLLPLRVTRPYSLTMNSKAPSSRTAIARLAVLLAFGIALPSKLSAATLAGDERFGLVGSGGKAFAARFGLKYYTLEGNYSAGNGNVFSSVNPVNDPDSGFAVVREVAKLNVRTDNLGETNAQFQTKLTSYAKALASWYPLPSCCRGSKPTFNWYHPDAAALVAAESLQIVEAIRRGKARNPPITGTAWEIGNEPNLFPAITPVEYAAIFQGFNRIIKAEDPAAKVVMGSVFIPETAVDLKARLHEELESKMRTELQSAGLYTAVNAAGYFDNLVDDMTNTLLSRMLALPTREYLRQVLVATASRPDIVSLHVYPYDDRAPTLDSAALRGILDSTLAGVRAQLASQGSPARLWITEFGNIEQGKTETEVATRSSELISAFKGQDSVERWFHYKSTGSDEQFALFSTGTPPLTRLAQDPAYIPASGAFPCAYLNAVGRAYYRESHGGVPCADENGLPALDSLSPESPAVNEGDSVRVMIHASDPEGDALSYLWIRANGDTVGRAAQLLFRPGYRDAGSETFTVMVTDSKAGRSSRQLIVVIANSALRPAILNPSGSPLSPTSPLLWGWPGNLADPDFESASMAATLEFYLDSASDQPSHTRAGVKEGTVPVTLTSAASTVWVRVKVKDGSNRESPWSDLRRLEWAGAPTSLGGPTPPGRVTFKAAFGRSHLLARVGLPRSAPVRLDLLDGDGSYQRNLFQGPLGAGWRSLTFGRAEGALVPGIHLLRLTADGMRRTVSIIVLP